MRLSLFHLPTFFPQFHASEAQFYQDLLVETDRAEALLRYLRTAGESNREAAYSEQYAAYKGMRQGFKLMDYDNYLYPHRGAGVDRGVPRVLATIGVGHLSLSKHERYFFSTLLSRAFCR
jgi:hypothetical protein